MKYAILFILFLTNLSHYYGQFFFIPLNEEFIECGDNNTIISTLEDWTIFTTENDLLDGPKIEKCHDYSSGIELDQLDNERVLFFESDTLEGYPINSNFGYSISFAMRLFDGSFCDNPNSNCPPEMKSYLSFIIKGEFENEEYFDTITIDNALAFFIGNGNNNAINYISCLATSKLENQELFKIVIAAAFDEYTDETRLILQSSISFSEFEDFFWNEFETRVIPNSFKTGSAYIVDSEFFYKSFTGFPFGHLMVKHDIPGLPSKDNIHYYEITPQDSTERSLINIVMGQESQLVFQSHTQLRGALVSTTGNDSLRHIINLVNSSEGFCLPPFIEVISGGEDAFVFDGGQIEFGNQLSCLQFRDQARMVIEKDNEIQYGSQGKGLLSLRPGASIDLKENATLNFNGQLIILENNASPTFVDLKPSTRLKFGKGSSIKTFEPEASLTIYMNGGQLDFSNLDEDSKQKITLVYPSINSHKPATISLYPNPATQQLFIQKITACESCSLIIFDANGKQMTDVIQLKNHEVSISVEDWSKGLYIVRDELGNSYKFVKI